MATERPRPALPHELAVAQDDRHSYMQHMSSLAGPGAYSIPSTFRRPAPNLLLRVVQRESFGREFSRQKRAPTESALDTPCQLCLVDTHRARRDQLRKLLQLGSVDHWSRDGAAPSPSERNSRPPSPLRADERGRKSPSSRSNFPSRRRWASAELADIVADFGEQPAPIESLEEDVAREQQQQQQQLCALSAPLTYQHFLMGTSYLERLKKQRQRAASQ